MKTGQLVREVKVAQLLTLANFLRTGEEPGSKKSTLTVFHVPGPL